MSSAAFDYVSWRPVRIQTGQIKELARRKGAVIVDRYVPALEELFLLRNPRFRFNKNYRQDFEKFLREHLKRESLSKAGKWFYFPWVNQLVHFLDEPLHIELKTGRNQFLILKSEQKNYYNATIGIIGMSVGSHAALTIALTGGGKNIRLADPDEISGSNLNRIRCGFSNIGLNKAIAVARQIYEANPYSRASIYSRGITDANIEKFLMKGGKLDVLIEETDSPYLKIKVRDLARKYRIPVIMAADNGDNIIVDVERYDLKKNTPILHGILGGMTADVFREIKPEDLPRTIAKIAGANMAVPRMLQSVMDVGKKIYAWPQLGTAATLCGAVLAYLTRQIVLGVPIQSQRTEVNLDSIFEPDYFSAKKIRSREKEKKQFFNTMEMS